MLLSGERQEAGEAEESLKGNLTLPWPPSQAFLPRGSTDLGAGNREVIGLRIWAKAATTLVNLSQTG